MSIRSYVHRTAVCAWVLLLCACRSEDGVHATPRGSAAGAGAPAGVSSADQEPKADPATATVDHLGAGPLVLRLVAPLGEVDVNSRSAVYADFDGDGLQDLYVAHFKAANALMLGGVDGEYVEADAGSASALAERSFDVCAGDLDGDGDPDLFVANSDGEPNALHLNRGNAVFAPCPAGSVQAPHGDSYAGVLVDIDGDGDLDLAVVNRAQANELHRNDGLGGMTLVTGDAFGEGAGNSRHVEAGDLDGDGDADLVVVQTDGEPDELFLNQGGRQGGTTGTFERVRGSPVSLATGRSSACAMADVDGDGDLDLAIVARKGDPTRVYRNLGDGRFEEAPDAIPPGDGGNSFACAFIDLDGTGGIDLLVADRQGPPHLFLNDGRGVFRRDHTLDLALAAVESTGIAVGAPSGAGGQQEVLLTDAKGPNPRLRTAGSPAGRR